MIWVLCIFFFKQKTAYEMLRSLVGSEMCIRDRTTGVSGRLGTRLGLQVLEYRDRTKVLIYR